MFLSPQFNFDNVDSSDKDIILVVNNNDLIELPFGIKQTVIEEKINYIDVPFFYGTNRESQSFPVSFARLNGQDWDNTERREIVNWLCQKVYKPFVSDDNPDIIYYVIFEEIKRYDNGQNNGYITCQARLNAPYGFTYPQYSRYDLSNNPIEGTKISICNASNFGDNYYPEIQITVVSGNSFSIQNTTDGGNTFTIDNLQVGEQVYINMANGRVKSNLPNTYHLQDTNKNWFKLIYGFNQVIFTGNVSLEIMCQFPVAL